MKTQAPSSHPLVWYVILFAVLVIAMIALLSRSAAERPPQSPAETAITAKPAP